MNDSNKVRIQKVLAQSGVASRRAIEDMILGGRITVNGELITRLPCFVDPVKDQILVDSRIVRKRPEKKVYVLLNKPKGVVCTQRDPSGRHRATDLVPNLDARVFCCGRLEVDSTGLIILTNDGELAERITHPRYGLVRTYVVEVAGQISPEHVEKLRQGAWVAGRMTQGARVRVVRRDPSVSIIEVRLTEGPNRGVRRVLARLGYKVRKLRRVAIGPVTDEGLKIAHYRFLTQFEIARLRGGAATSGNSARRRRTNKENRA